MAAVAVGMGTAVVAIGSVAGADHSPGLIYACVADSGSIRIVSASAGCRSKERAEHWPSQDTDTDTDTTYSAGAGLALSGTTFSAHNVPWSAVAVPQALQDGFVDLAEVRGTTGGITAAMLAGNDDPSAFVTGAVTSAKIADNAVEARDLSATLRATLLSQVVTRHGDPLTISSTGTTAGASWAPCAANESVVGGGWERTGGRQAFMTKNGPAVASPNGSLPVPADGTSTADGWRVDFEAVGEEPFTWRAYAQCASPLPG